MSFQSSTIDPQGKRSIPSVSVEVNLIVKSFQGRPAGTTMSYDELRQMLGCGKTKLYSYLSSARSILRRKHSMWLETVRGEGVRVASDDGKLNAMSADMTRGGRAFRAAVKKADIIDYEALPSDARKREFIARSNGLSALRLLTAPSAVTKLVQTASTEMLPGGKVLELFRN